MATENKTKTLDSYIKRNFGFDAFYNADGYSVSFYIPWAYDGKFGGEKLFTVRHYCEADKICAV